jgi:hypothetical protein
MLNCGLLFLVMTINMIHLQSRMCTSSIQETCHIFYSEGKHCDKIVCRGGSFLVCIEEISP